MEDETARWEESATLDVSLQDIPRMARLCFLLYAAPEKKTTKTKARKFKVGKAGDDLCCPYEN